MMSSRRDSHLISLTSHVDTLPPSDHEVLADTGDGHPLPPGQSHHHHEHHDPHHGVTSVLISPGPLNNSCPQCPLSMTQF